MTPKQHIVNKLSKKMPKPPIPQNGNEDTDESLQKQTPPVVDLTQFLSQFQQNSIPSIKRISMLDINDAANNIAKSIMYESDANPNEATLLVRKTEVLNKIFAIWHADLVDSNRNLKYRVSKNRKVRISRKRK